MSFQSTISGSVITIRDETSGSSAEIYAFGALLNQFSAEYNGVAVNVIDGFASPADAMGNLTPFFKSAKLSPFVCRVKDARYKFGESNHQLAKYASKGHALHGLLYNVLFSIKHCSSDDTAATVQLEYIYDNEMEGFPFCYKCLVEYKLTAGNELTVSTTISNLDQKLMPAVDGWHPYFGLGDSADDYQLEFQSKEMLEFDEELIPSGKLIPYQEFGSLKELGPLSLNHCFTLNFAECQPLCVLRNSLKKIQLEIYPSSSYPYLQIFTPDHRKSIAIENLSGAPDAFNNGMGLQVLSPGGEAVFSTKFVIHFLNDSYAIK